MPHSRLGTRANWFKTHVLEPDHSNRAKHDIKIPHKQKIHIAEWNPTGIMEAGKIATIIRAMKKLKIDIMVLPESHIKEPDQYLSAGYTVSHSADEREDQEAS